LQLNFGQEVVVSLAKCDQLPTTKSPALLKTVETPRPAINALSRLLPFAWSRHATQSMHMPMVAIGIRKSVIRVLVMMVRKMFSPMTTPGSVAAFATELWKLSRGRSLKFERLRYFLFKLNIVSVFAIGYSPCWQKANMGSFCGD
jgi:hypothetical protein